MIAPKMRIARVFPRRTQFSPTDSLAFFGPPPMLILLEIDEVHISVAFTYDMRRAEELAEAWRVVGVPVRIGGPALNEPGGDFVPGMYVKHGITVTSRGCPNRCWFCSVPAREGYEIRELPIRDGWNVIDDNLLACSEKHIRAVFRMLSKQKRRPVFSGGLEARLLKAWHVDLLRESRAKRLYMAYDTPDDYEPLLEAGKLLRAGGITRQSHKAACYVLIGYPGDTMEAAETRLREAWRIGVVPYAMLFKDEQGREDADWRHFQRHWIRPEIVLSKLKEVGI